MTAVRAAHSSLLFILNIKGDSYRMRYRQVVSLLRISFGRLQFYRETHLFSTFRQKKGASELFK